MEVQFPFLMYSLYKKVFEIRKKYFNNWNTNGERYAHPPPGWPDDQWKWLVDYWPSPEFEKKRQTGKDNRSNLQMLHTGGSENFENKQYNIIEKMDNIPNDHTGICSKNPDEVVDEVLCPSTKGRERMHGRTAPKKKQKLFSQADVNKIQEETRQQVLTQFAQQVEEVTRKAREEAEEDARRKANEEAEEARRTSNEEAKKSMEDAIIN